jgi:hypothetical protein
MIRLRTKSSTAPIARIGHGNLANLAASISATALAASASRRANRRLCSFISCSLAVPFIEMSVCPERNHVRNHTPVVHEPQSLPSSTVSEDGFRFCILRNGYTSIGPVNDQFSLREVPTVLLAKELVVVADSKGLAFALFFLLRELMD